MSYNKEWKTAFIQNQTELFAFMLYLNAKYNKKEDIETLLNSLLNSGWHIGDRQRKALLKNAKKIANEKYGLKTA